MINNYLEEVNKERYLDRIQSDFLQDVYLMEIDEQVDIFSELPVELFTETSKKQISEILNSFKKEYVKCVNSRKINSVLPKLEYHIDSEGASIIQLASSWSEGNANLYFAFKEEDDESSFGMVWNDNRKKNFESRSGSIMMNSIDDIIHEVLDFIFRVY